MQLALPNVPALYLVRLLYSARASRERYSNIATQLHTYVRERGEKEEAILTLLTYLLVLTAHTLLGRERP